MISLKAAPLIDAMKHAGALELQKIQAQLGRKPQLTVVLVGNDSASQIYVRNKQLAAAEWGIEAVTLNLPESISPMDFQKAILDLNQKNDVDAILVQLPLPPHLSSAWVAENLDPRKDADGVTIPNLGRLVSGKPVVEPCTPQGILRLLDHYQIEIAGKHVVVVGRSLIVGKPLALMLTQRDATVTLCHSKTLGLAEITRQADLVVVAAGKACLLDVSRGDFKKNAVVVDVGIHRLAESGGKLCGDVGGTAAAGERLKALSPVPGGVGPMTIACLMRNTLELCKKKLEQK